MHDYVILDIRYLWSEMLLGVTVRNKNSADVTIEYGGVTQVEIPHKNTWGESSSINEYVEFMDDEKEFIARIEMQSGDVISFKYERRLTPLPV